MGPMIRKISLANEIITLVMYFIMAVTLFWSFQIVIDGKLAPVNLQVIFVLYFAGVLVIRFMVRENFLLYIGCHILLFFTLFAVPYSGLIIFEYIVFLVSLLAQSIAYWNGISYQRNADIPAVSFMLMFIFYIYAFATHHDVMKNYLFVTGSLYLVLYLVRLYLKGLHSVSHGKVVHKQLPLEQLVKSNSAIVGMVIVATVIAIGLANIINADNLLYIIGDGIVAVIKFVVKTIVIFLNWLTRMFAARHGNVDELMSSMEEAIREESVVAKIIDLIVSLVTIAFFLLFMRGVLRGLYKQLVYFLKDNILPTDHVEKLSGKKDGRRMFAESIKKHREKLRNPVRLEYKKKILKLRDHLVLTEAMTTGDIERQMTEEEAADMRSLKEAYEKERYCDEL